VEGPALRDEVIELARELIRLDTSNPPGRETPAAELLAAYLDASGVECELVGPDPERLNLVARIEGGEAPSLMLMAHTDVVPAPSADWTVPPFAGEVRDGHLMGRGAADMKGELAARAVAMAALARGGEPPAGDVVFVAESDEERNTAGVGMSWLVRERPDLQCDYAINESGGLLLELSDGRRVVTISVGEKQVTSLRLRFFGSSAHASAPAGVDNVLRHASRAVERLLDHPAPLRIQPVVARALAALGEAGEDEAAVNAAAAQHPLLAGLLHAMTRMTITPTGLHTHEPANVIPPYADVVCDCRPLPGDTEADVREQLSAALGDDLVYELELLEPLEGGTESPADTALYAACERYVAERLPGAELLPIISTGFTDSHWVRSLGTAAYGFAPVFATDPDLYTRGMHGPDESLAVDDLVEMVSFNLYAIGSLGPPA